MNYTTTIHPSEEILTDCALDELDTEIKNHLSECSECNEFVEDVRTISNEIAAIEEKEIPQYLREKILAISHKKKQHNFVDFIQNWYKNPFFYGIMTFLFVIIIYVVFTILL